MRILISCVALLVGSDAAAISRIAIDSAALRLPGQFEAQQMHAVLDLTAGDRAALLLDAIGLSLTSGAIHFDRFTVRCGGFDWRATHYRCGGGSFTASLKHAGSAARLPNLDLISGNFVLELDAALQQLSLDADRLELAGGSWQLRARWQAGNWQVDADSGKSAVAGWLDWLQPVWQLPVGTTISGLVAVNVSATGHALIAHTASLRASFNALDLQNAAGTIVTEKLAALVDAQLSGDIAAPTGTVHVTGGSGQALVGPVYMDMTSHPLEFTAKLRVQGTAVDVSSFALELRQLLQASGSAVLSREPRMTLERADFNLKAVQFPAAFASFLQGALATTNFGALETRGEASAQLAVRNGQMTSIDAQLNGLDLIDRARELQLVGLRGPLHWRADGAPAPAVSTLGWQQLRVGSLAGGPSEIALSAQGNALRLDRPARLAIFDGALDIQRFAAQQLGSDSVSLSFDATIEPISMPLLSVAFGWPAMAGKLSGQIPGIEFRDGVLNVAGDMVANVFDGQITVSKLQLRNLLSRFPRLTAEVAARQLDLEQITRTFPIGSITGRLDADVRGLELFDWSPIAFDAELYSTIGDKTRHRISQKAVDSISRLGGGGGLGSALQSGLLRFFDDFGYERIGLRCQLRNDVCLMSGIDKGGGTYYMVKGGGIPRIDVVGNAGRVAWKQLVSQVSAALASDKLVVK